MLTARLGVKDLERELKFYAALGFEVERRTGGAVVTHSGAMLTLEPHEELRVKDSPLLDWDRNPAQVGTGVQFYILVPDVDAFAAAIPVGISRPWPVQDKSWGLREITLKTPTGFLLTFAQRR